MLGINRNNDVILLLETNMAASWLKCWEKKRLSMEQRRHLLVFSQQMEKKQTLYATHINVISYQVIFLGNCLL